MGGGFSRQKSTDEKQRVPVKEDKDEKKGGPVPEPSRQAENKSSEPGDTTFKGQGFQLNP